MAIQSPLGIRGISQGIAETRKNVSASVATANSITKLVESRTKVSGDIFRRGSILRSRRLEASKRQEMEDEIEAGRLNVSTSQGATVVAQRGSGGFLGRIMQAIAALGIGWLLNNLPTWIAMGKEFIARIQRTGEILGGFVSNVISLLRGFGNVVGSLASNLSRFDLTDSSGKLQESFSELELTLGSMGDQLQEGFKMLMSPLSEGVASGENAPATGTEQPSSLYPDVDSRGGASGASGVSPWGPLLGLIASKESGGNYEAMAPMKTLPGATKMTISEVASKATGAVGKYQQLPQYLVKRAKAAGLNPDKDLFSPENQDLIAAKVNIGQNRGGNQWLQGKITDEQFMQKLSMEFAVLPNAQGKFYHSGQGSSITPAQVKGALNQVKKGSSTPSTNIASSGTPGSNLPSAAGKLAQAASQLKGTSTRSGPDGGRNACVYAINMVFAKAGIKTPWGSALRVSNAESAMIKAGWKEVPINQRQAGDIIIIYDNDPREPQIHIGVVLANGNMLSNSSRRGSFVWEDSPENQFKTYAQGRGYGKCYRMPGGGIGAPTQLAAATNVDQNVSKTAARINPMDRSSQTQTAAMSAPERKGEQVYVVNTGTNQQQIMGGPNQPSDSGMQMSEFDLVNTFMKNKLLLDLAYL